MYLFAMVDLTLPFCSNVNDSGKRVILIKSWTLEDFTTTIFIFAGTLFWTLYFYHYKNLNKITVCFVNQVYQPLNLL